LKTVLVPSEAASARQRQTDRRVRQQRAAGGIANAIADVGVRLFELPVKAEKFMRA
jgi:hypothetical protein